VRLQVTKNVRDKISHLHQRITKNSFANLAQDLIQASSIQHVL